VNERWVCKRCFADNDDTNVACHRCGLARGAEATETDQAAWAAQAGAGPVAQGEQPAWQRWARYWWIPVLVVVLAVGYLLSARRGDDGSLTSAGNVGVDDLRAGDCFNTGDDVEISDVDGVPCSEAHEYEVFAVATHEGDGTFPSDAELDGIFSLVCEPPFEEYVGEPYATSAIWGTMISPSEESFSDGDREYICVLYDPDNAALTTSLRNANR
jgi:Septum formation